jgi:hypothetical protein
MKNVLTIFILIFFTKSYGQSKIYGVVKDELSKKNLIGTYINLLKLDSVSTYKSVNFFNEPYIQSDSFYKVVDRVLTDTNGYYQFISSDSGIYKIQGYFEIDEHSSHHFCEGESYETKSFKKDYDNTIEKLFTLHVTCEYDSTKNLSSCPKCNRDDSVLLIRYGMWLMDIDATPDEKEYFYDGYCDFPRCRATKFCKRCKLRF